jgi:hypothetical protein
VPAEPIVLQARMERRDPCRLHLDRPVADGGEHRGRRVAQPAQQARGECTGAGARFRHRERVGPAERLPRLLQQPADGGAEDRIRLRGGEEVALPARSRRGPPVVAELGLVQRSLHEPREGDGPAVLDLAPDPRREDRVLTDAPGIRERLAPVAGRGPRAVVRHRAPRSARRTPGPTSVWPPRSTGTGALAADRVSAASQGSRM